jgi:large subunit ribosomal protein L22
MIENKRSLKVSAGDRSVSAAKNRNNKKFVTVRLRYARISAQKLNLAAKVLRAQSLQFGEKFTNFSKTKAAKIIGKLLKSGKAAAGLKGLDTKKMFISQLLTDQGPSLKRGRPVARGSYHPIIKKMAHITLTLKEKDYGAKS